MPTSDTHRIAVTKQDNGELHEEVLERDLAEGDGGAAPATEVDRQSVASFPASDAPSTWAGPAHDRAEPGAGDGVAPRAAGKAEPEPPA